MVDRLLKLVSDNKNIRNTRPVCFFLDWDKKCAEWRTIHDLPPKESLKFSTKIQWTDCNKMDIKICSNYHCPSKIILRDKKDTVYNNESYLKSHLQKCVRRSNTFKALKTAKHFMDLNIENFLRRLSIIAIEDSLPLDGYCVLVWFVAALSKGYYLSDSQICWIYGYLHSLCMCPYYEPPTQLDKLDFMKLKTQRLLPEDSHLIYSIFLRKSYGGMSGDKHMLNQSTKLWFHRYLSKSSFTKYLNREKIFITPPTDPLDISEWYLSGIDFHCCVYMVPNLAEKFELDEADIKSAIWYFSSSVTDKKDIINTEDGGEVRDLSHIESQRERLLPVWKKISKGYFNSARYYLKTQSGF